jgi:IS6 family transposase
MSKALVGCPGCGLTATRKNGRDHQGRRIHQCLGCRRRFTALTGTPFSGYRFPPDIIALAVRWYLRYRLSYADVAELLAERGVRVDASTVFDWVREFAPLYEDTARPFRHAVGSTWSVDETYTKIAGKTAYVYRAIDGHGQVVDVYVSRRRAAADAAAFFRRAIEATGVIPDEVTTDGAAAYPRRSPPPSRRSHTRRARRSSSASSATTSTSKGDCARCAGSKRWPGRGYCAGRTRSCATCGAGSTTSRARPPRLYPGPARACRAPGMR